MSKTSVEIDQDILHEAAEILGTQTLRATIDAALREVVHAKRRLEEGVLGRADALVAATAEARDLAVLHYDADFELVARITGQDHKWIVTRGSAD